MSSEFYFRKVAPFVIEAIETHGTIAFDTFWEGNWGWDDDYDCDDEASIQSAFRAIGPVEMLNRQRDTFLPLLREGRHVHGSIQDCCSENGWEIREYNFLLVGRARQFYEADFLVREVELNQLNQAPENLLLVNALVGCRKIGHTPGQDAAYFSPIDVCEILSRLPEILDDDLALRWERLQRLYPNEYVPPKSLQEAFFGDSEWPRQFLQETWLPFLQDAAKRGCGILTVLGY